MPTISIRQATLQDVEALVILRLAFFVESLDVQPESIPALRDNTRRYFSKAIPEESFIAWVAEVQGEIVATSGLVFFQRPPSEDNPNGLEAYILNMYTVPQWRRMGIAAQLLERLIERAKQTNAQRIWLRATPDGKPLYEKRGFVPKTRHTLEMELCR
ncbi:GNAT family N-acetyltransferase [Ktedonosporobacter rubrisoli]|uniref:GNAT family N-acetyltransferase n=1 Tax=Ktedonosporobacter rubrisoli TaxID=2509675 RepID=A0A4P6JS75_KTERU|nr:GNAT family N-acetyltransferase [Ktedonosporobacter rubrisoli]QBD77696.1 GNAT family N-acetyltransferase [Ktedonosporobacter rubrisoli]